MSTPTDRPSIDERYSSATHATKLTVDPDHTGAADMLIAAGWSESRLGTALLRLVSEWDGASKPQPMHARGINILAIEIAREKGRDLADADHKEARQQAVKWLEHEHKILMGKLKTLPEVRAALTAWVHDQRIPDHQTVAAETLMWWLDATCKHCHGRKWEIIKDTGRLSDKVCPACRGSGYRPHPAGIHATPVLIFLDRCVQKGRESMKYRLRQFAPHKEKTT